MAKAIKDKITEFVQKYGTHIAQVVVLGEILCPLDTFILSKLRELKEMKKEVDITALAREMHIQQPECSLAVKKLEKVGGFPYFTKYLIETYTKNNRSKYVRITEVGEGILEGYVYIGDTNKEFIERLVANVRKKNPKVVDDKVLKELVEKD